jgi:flagellar hook-associated protein 3 FlgL
MMTNSSVSSLQTNLAKLSKIQEQITTGKVLNRPSDSPTDTSSAMRLRAALAQQNQYTRNVNDGNAWLGQIDNALGTAADELNRAHDIALQGANTVSMDQTARDALAAEVDQIRSSLIATGNTTYLDRPVFGGVTAGSTAYDSGGTFVGTTGTVNRSVADGVKVAVNVNGPDAFGATGDSVFDHLTALAAALRSNDTSGISATVSSISADVDRVNTVRSEVGARENRLDAAGSAASNTQLSLTSSIGKLENVDLTEATVNLQAQQVTYQASLAATARVIQPSLLDFLN